MIPFNKPYLTGKETQYIEEAVNFGKISGNGEFTRRCQNYFQEYYGFKKCLLTTSCTDALEMSAILCDIKEGDEVIVPSYTFVSSALAFVRQGANIIFADSRPDHPGIDEDKIEELISSKTKAIVIVHYAGVACDMEKIMHLAEKYNLYVIEDAAQAVDSFFTFSDGRKKALGSIGHFGTFSFHETKNIQCGEGGMLAINDEKFFNRAEIIWEKGTNRAEFFRGEVNKYGWVDTGSSFLPSEIIAAFLWAQIENLSKIQSKRLKLWNIYYEELKILEEKGFLKFASIPNFATNNAHMFYLVFPNIEERTKAINTLKEKGFLSVFHYLSLHSSEYYKDKYKGEDLPQSDRYTDCLLRLPLFVELQEKDALASMVLR
jgi:dTDP-4-amino-4,6-dideoxygalactose transaminase